MRGYAMSNYYGNSDNYLVQKVMTASPEQLTSYLYDIAIVACNRKDRVKACKAVQELINSLSFDHKEIATSFFQVYRYTLNAIQDGKFDAALEILTGLKSSWVEAMKVT